MTVNKEYQIIIVNESANLIDKYFHLCLSSLVILSVAAVTLTFAPMNHFTR